VDASFPSCLEVLDLLTAEQVVTYTTDNGALVSNSLATSTITSNTVAARDVKREPENR